MADIFQHCFSSKKKKKEEEVNEKSCGIPKHFYATRMPSRISYSTFQKTSHFISTLSKRWLLNSNSLFKHLYALSRDASSYRLPLLPKIDEIHVYEKIERDLSTVTIHVNFIPPRRIYVNKFRGLCLAMAWAWIQRNARVVNLARRRVPATKRSCSIAWFATARRPLFLDRAARETLFRVDALARAWPSLCRGGVLEGLLEATWLVFEYR